LMVLTEVAGHSGAAEVTGTRVEDWWTGIDEPEGLPVGLPEPVETGTEAVSVAVTGQTVVETAMVSVTTSVDSAGQCETVSGHLVTVRVWVEYTVEVVMGTTDEVT